MSDEDFLDELLSEAVNELEKSTKKTLTETNIFDQENNINNEIGGTKRKNLSVIHNGDTDSSDDEDNKYFEEKKYNQYGKEIKQLLPPAPSCSRDNIAKQSSTWSKKIENGAPKPAIKTDVYTDPVFGLRIVNPLISFTTLQDRMQGRESVSFANVKKFVAGNISEKNWVIAGVIVSKSSVKTSQKGNPFLIWSLSDLKNDIKIVSMFLFKSAYKQLWKTAPGTVVAILNPSVLDKKDGSKDEACLSVDNAQKVMIIGQSRDLGTCKSVKKNGEPCTAIVNVSRCEYCIYHIKQEYQKCSKRSELQSNFTGKGLTALRNKVLGKNEVFYAGKSYTAIPAKRSAKLEQRDRSRLQSLADGASTLVKNAKTSKKKFAASLEISQRQRSRDLALLEKLGGEKTDFNASHSSEVTLESSKSTALEVIARLKSQNESKTPVLSAKTPVLSEEKEQVVDLNVSATPQQINKAKLMALKYVKEKGPLKKSDPNSVKKDLKKRPAEVVENDSKKRKITENEFLSDRFKKMMEATSKHSDLLEERDNEEQEKYFYKLEKKEMMEEKMINTFKMACKAVRCLKCKYTHFSAAQTCKDEKHPLKVFDAVKRFFKCGDCGNRVQCLEVVPTRACRNCGSGKWEKTGMMREKTVTTTPVLSIRGGEQKFVNSVVTDANVDLLVPE